LTPELRLAIGAAISLMAAAALAPAAIRVSQRTGFLDRPEGWKSHVRPTPLLGGVAVVLACCAGVWAASDDVGRVAPIAAGMLALMALGILDDWTPLKAGHKVPAEMAAATLLWSTGLGWEIGPDPVDLAVTVVWVVAVINAINLFDLLDGQATTLMIVVAAACAALAMTGADPAVACASAALAGACLGFLPFNVATPARVFLGDAGTIPLGFAAAALTTAAIDSTVPGWTGLMVGVVLLGLPLLDMALRIAMRVRRRVSIYTAGHDSAVTALRARLRSTLAVSFVAGAGQAALSAAAIASVAMVAMGVLLAVSLALGLGAVWFLLGQRMDGEAETAIDRVWPADAALAVSHPERAPSEPA
jgi:UDP-GlcNAc:undecaprenyl-phosphate GlcNAc-1-phosphate transferase